MARAFLGVIYSVGSGGAPYAEQYFNVDVPDTGSNTVGHIAQACANGQAEDGRSGPLHLPNMVSLGLGEALRLASDDTIQGLEGSVQGRWAVAQEASKGKDTPSGHWELAGCPVPWDWHYFPVTKPTFPKQLRDALCRAAGTQDILGDEHASGTEVIARLGDEHLRTGYPICYTSVDSVLQIAAHEEHFGLERLLQMCRDVAPMLHDMKVGRVIARPFLGSDGVFTRTANRQDFAVETPATTLCDWARADGRSVHAIGKIKDIFSGRGIDTAVKGDDAALMVAMHEAVADAPDGSLTFANFVEFDSLFGHRRDVSGYARALEWIDVELGKLIPLLRADDLLVITADHGNDPTWVGTDHTRERVPVLMHGAAQGSAGIVNFVDVAASVATHLGLGQTGTGRSFL